ncbi:hypothetical protein ACFW04_014370 [Cataglyphis niger]
MDPERIQSASNDEGPLKRDHDSVDDFEHLGHDGSPDDRSDQQQPLRLIDAPRVDDLLNIGDSFQTTDSVLPSALVDVETKSVPATPPPSADFDKCEAMAQSSDPFQRPLDPVDPKLASMAFVETERSYPALAHQFRDDDNDDNGKIGLQVPLLPISTATADVLSSSATKTDSKVQLLQEPEDISSLGKRHEDHQVTPSSGTNRVDEELGSREDIGSSVLPTAEKSPIVDFLGDEDAPPKEDKTRNIMDDDSWNVVEKVDVKREQGEKVPEPPTKPLPPLPKEAELLEDSARQDKYEMSNDFPIAEPAKPSAPQRDTDSEHESAKRHQAPRAKETDYSRPVDKKKQEMEIAPKEIFRDMGLGVVALFTLPKIYETNQEQIDQNLALVQAKITEITAKVKAAIPLGKKAEPLKEE